MTILSQPEKIDAREENFSTFGDVTMVDSKTSISSLVEIVEPENRMSRSPEVFVRRMKFPKAEDDGAGGIRILEPDHEYTVRIPWIPIIVAAASALVEAFASKLGENIADHLFKSAVGGDEADRRWKTEVLQRLANIERKIDGILLELQSIPGVVRQVVREENIRVQVSDIQSRIVQVGTYFGAWLENRDDTSRLTDLRNAISNLLTNVSSLLRQEQYRYALVMQTLIAVIPIIRYIAQEPKVGDPTVLRFLGDPCRDLRDLCTWSLNLNNEGSIANI